ncbi:MAG TPA: hypothetical protein VGQ59_08330 [Cyclobacteriaceae bacterium]|nr:hypothetical protein [Cyclobacteriaceae bacterium]
MENAEVKKSVDLLKVNVAGQKKIIQFHDHAVIKSEFTQSKMEVVPVAGLSKTKSILFTGTKYECLLYGTAKNEDERKKVEIYADLKAQINLPSNRTNKEEMENLIKSKLEELRILRGGELLPPKEKDQYLRHLASKTGGTLHSTVPKNTSEQQRMTP